MKRRSDSRKLDRARTIRRIQLRPALLRTSVRETPPVHRFVFMTGVWYGGFFVAPSFTSRNRHFLTRRINRSYRWRY